MSRLDGVETKLGKLGLFERLENVEAAVSKNCTELNLVNEKTKVIQNNVEEIEKGIVFANSQIEGLEKKDDENACRMRWNLIFHGIPETDDESCSDLIKHTMVSKLKMDQRKVKATMFCGAHRLGRRKRASNNNKPRPIIVRFTCRADRDSTWRQRYNLKGSSTRIAEDLPQNVREIRRDVLVPALKNARKCEGTKATIIGDRLLVNGKRYSFDKIPRKWQNVSQAPDDEMHNATHDEEPEQAQASQAND